jgi:hypothetical protein
MFSAGRSDEGLRIAVNAWHKRSKLAWRAFRLYAGQNFVLLGDDLLHYYNCQATYDAIWVGLSTACVFLLRSNDKCKMLDTG